MRVFFHRGAWRLAHDDDVFEIAQLLPSLYLGIERFAHHRHSRPRIVQDVVIVRSLKQRVDRDREPPRS